MMPTLFIPDTFGSYYIFSRRIVSCEVIGSHIRVVVIKAQGFKRTIEMVFDEALEVAAIKKMFETIGRYDLVLITISSGLIVFKEMEFPFKSLAKIKLALPFEMEPLLPFPLHEAVIDCMVTHRNTQTVVLGAAIKRNILQEQTRPFEEVGVTLDKITVDFFELYAMYQEWKGKEEQDRLMLICLDADSMRLGIITSGKLTLIRVLTYGYNKLARLLEVEPAVLMRQGIDFDNPDTTEKGGIFFSDIKFTIAAFLNKSGEEKRFGNIVLMSEGVDIKGIREFCEHILHNTCELFTVRDFLQKSGAYLEKSIRVANKFIVGLASSLIWSRTREFNLNYEYALEEKSRKLNWQLGVAGLLLTTIFFVVLGTMFYNIYLFKKAISRIELETIAVLKKDFPELLKRKDVSGSSSLEVINRAAKAEVAREKNIWFALSPQNRASFLVYLQEIFPRFDPVGLGLDLRRLTLTEDTLTLEGHVENYETLKRFEEDLRAIKILGLIPKLEELTFNVKIPLEKSRMD